MGVQAAPDDPGLVEVVSPALVRRQVRWLCAATATALASVVVSGALVSFHLERSSPDSIFAPFDGWQVDAVEAGIAAVSLALVAASSVAVVRLIRRLRHRTPHRRLAVLVAILPGLFMGAVLAVPTRSAIAWASDHTAVASAERAHLRGMLADYRKHPTVFPFAGAPAPAGTRRRLLAVSDLGPGWYAAGVTETALRASAPATRFGGNTIVRTGLTNERWVAGSWQLDTLVMESMVIFPTVQDAERDVADWLTPTSCSCSKPPGRASAIRIGGSTVWQRTRAGGWTVTFVVDDAVFTLIASDPRPKTLEDTTYREILTAAVRRARAHS